MYSQKSFSCNQHKVEFASANDSRNINGNKLYFINK